jgi:hypothetical protein
LWNLRLWRNETEDTSLLGSSDMLTGVYLRSFRRILGLSCQGSNSSKRVPEDDRQWNLQITNNHLPANAAPITSNLTLLYDTKIF